MLVVPLTVLGVGASVYWVRFRKPPTDDLSVSLAELTKGNFEPAHRQSRALKDSPKDQPRFALLQGAMLLRRGHSLLSIDKLKQASEEPALREDALLRLGEAWYQLGRHIEAEEAWSQVLKRNPDCVAAHRWLAASYYDLGAVKHAIEHLTQTARLDPHDARPHRLLGLINKDYERYEEAVPCYQESLRRKSDQPAAQEIREEMADCLCRLQNHREAVAVLELCEPTLNVQVLRAECQHALGNATAAQAQLTKVLEVEPTNLQARLLRGTILLEENQASEAVKALEQASLAHPKDYTAHFKLSQAYARAGQESQAAEAAKRAEQIRGIRKEFADLHQVAWDEPTNRAVRLRLAALASELDRADLADVWLKSAAALLPSTPSQSPAASKE